MEDQNAEQENEPQHICESEEMTDDNTETLDSATPASHAPVGQKPEVSRRDFLRVGSLSVVGLSVAEKAARAQMRKSFQQRSCILLKMTGGPSQLETFDPKPEAPLEIRGPVKSIQTAIPGVRISESLPRLAERAANLTFLRSLNHSAAPIHETGMQLLQTGRLASRGLHHPSFGSIIAHELGPRNEIAPYVVLPQLISNTGMNAPRGESAGWLGDEFQPLTDSSGNQESIFTKMLPKESEAVRLDYGETHFGKLCLQARQLVECGVRCVVVNLFDSLYGKITWDAHGHSTASPATVYDYRDQLCPAFDRAVSVLLDDLQQRGILDDTLVVATGEFGRTPHINSKSGRDHWPKVWSGILAGGGMPAGQVIGTSDNKGAEPIDRPMQPGEVSATILDFLGIDTTRELNAGDDLTFPVSDFSPIPELSVE